MTLPDPELVECIARVLSDRYPSPPGQSTIGHRGDARAIATALTEQGWLATARIESAGADDSPTTGPGPEVIAADEPSWPARFRLWGRR